MRQRTVNVCAQRLHHSTIANEAAKNHSSLFLTAPLINRNLKYSIFWHAHEHDEPNYHVHYPAWPGTAAINFPNYTHVLRNTLLYSGSEKSRERRNEEQRRITQLSCFALNDFFHHHHPEPPSFLFTAGSIKKRSRRRRRKFCSCSASL